MKKAWAIVRIAKFIYKVVYKIVDDTLRRDKDGVRRFSKTALTMFTAWLLVVYTYLYDLITNGFRWETFILMAGVATGMKTFDAIAKTLNKTNNTQ